MGRWTLRRLRPWHRVLARSRGARLDRELPGGMSQEASATLAARAIRLTSTGFRRELAASLQRILAAGEPPAVLRSQMPATCPSYADGAAMADRAEAGYPARTRARAAHPPSVAAPAWATAARPPRIPLRLERVSQSAPLLAELASRLAEPGPVPVKGVAIVSQLLADGTDPLYRAACWRTSRCWRGGIGCSWPSSAPGWSRSSCAAGSARSRGRPGARRRSRSGGWGPWGRGSSRITGPGAGYAPTGSGAYGPAARWSGTAGLT